MASIDDLVMNVQEAIEARDYDRDFSAQIAEIDAESNGHKHKVKKEVLARFGIKLNGASSCASLATQVDNILFFSRWGVEKFGRIYQVSAAASQYNMKTWMKPRIRDLISYGVPLSKVGYVLENAPRVTCHGADIIMREDVTYLLERVKIPQNKLGEVILRRPQLLTFSITNLMEPCVRHLESIGIRDDDLTHVATVYPTIISSNCQDNLIPTLSYLMNELGLGVGDLVPKPNYVGYSLEGRIKPRHEFLKSRGITVGEDVSVYCMIMRTDPVFVERVAKSTLEEYHQFRKKYFARAA
ncbi:MAG: hypothetical protein ABIG93_02455 [archaeon]|nr:hypothetical protein [Nanoarchaeota archaeon]